MTAGVVTVERIPPDYYQGTGLCWVALLDGGLLLAYGDTEDSARSNLVAHMQEVHEATGEALKIELNRP